MPNPFVGLLRSRKFLLAAYGVVQTLVLHYLAVPSDIITAVDALVIVVIAGIAAEDAAAKHGGLIEVSRLDDDGEG